MDSAIPVVKEQDRKIKVSMTSLINLAPPDVVIITIIIMSLTPVSSSNKDIGGAPSMRSSYFEK